MDNFYQLSHTLLSNQSDHNNSKYLFNENSALEQFPLSNSPSTTHPKYIYIWTDDPELPALYFNPLINLILLCGFTLKNLSHEDSIWWNGADGDDFKLPEDVAPFLKHRDFENGLTADGIAL